MAGDILNTMIRHCIEARKVDSCAPLSEAVKTAAELVKLKALDETSASLEKPTSKRLQARQVRPPDPVREVPQQHREEPLRDDLPQHRLARTEGLHDRPARVRAPVLLVSPVSVASRSCRNNDRLLTMSLAYFELYFTSGRSKSIESSLYRISLPQTIKGFDHWFIQLLGKLIDEWAEKSQSSIIHWREWQAVSLKIRYPNNSSISSF